MIAKSFVLLAVFFISGINGGNMKYTLDSLAGGWLKFHNAATWDDASIRCRTEGAVLASPLNSQLREALRNYVSRSWQQGATIFTGVKADFSTGDYYSMEGVSLQKMPVIIRGSSVNYDSAKSCVQLMTGKASVKAGRCDKKLPFVCYKKMKTWVIAGCGTPNKEYKYNNLTGSCYKFHPKGLTWSEAQMKCEQENAYLAINNNELENDVLEELFAEYPISSITSSDTDQAFMGIRNWLEGESWQTVQGESLEEAGFTGWRRNEPNNAGRNENCVLLHRDGTYNDDRCELSVAFICEKSPEILYT